MVQKFVLDVKIIPKPIDIDKPAYHALFIIMFTCRCHAQDHAIGCNETFLHERLNGSYLPYEDGKNKSIFIRDPQHSSQLLIGKVSSDTTDTLLDTSACILNI